MTASRSWDLTPSVRERFRILIWIGDNGGTSPGRIISLTGLLGTGDQEADQGTAAHLLDMEEAGLLNLQTTLSWSSWSCDVTASGVSLIEEVRATRDGALGRRKECRDAVLHWLYNEDLGGTRSPNISAFPKSPFGDYLGQPFTAKEIADASDWLKAEGYINGSSTWNAGVIRPSITARGQKVVESERSVNAQAQQPAPYSVTTVNVTGSGNNVAANSSNVTQTTTVTMTDENSRQLLGLAESLAKLTNSGLLELNEDQTREAALVVESLRETAEQDAAPGQDVRTILDKAKTIALAGTGTAIGQTFVAAVDQVIQALGLG
jgi:hypothetical protein